MKIFGLSITTIVLAFAIFWLGTRFPNALNFRRG